MPWVWLKTRPQESGALALTLRTPVSRSAIFAVSPDSSFLVSATADGSLKMWNLRSGIEQATLLGHTGWVLACAISPEGSFIVSSDFRRHREVVEQRNGQRMGQSRGPYWSGTHIRRWALDLLRNRSR